MLFSTTAGRFVVVAPYCPTGRGGYTALGAAAKIEAVLAGLSRNGEQPQLLNTGHQIAAFSLGRKSVLRVNDRVVEEILPPQLMWRPLGKLFQALLAPFYAVALCRRRSTRGLWLYNPYLFEVIFGLCARLVHPGLSIILELEDAPMARPRSGTGQLKAKLDNLALRLISRRATVITLVQPALRNIVTGSDAQVVDLPVLLHSESVVARHAGLKDGAGARVGYFGGLSAEKGADKLLETIRTAGADITWQITGAGEYEEAFRVLAQEMPKRVQFHGTVSAERLKTIYSEVDAILNLHRPLEEFADGIFPFKLLEAVGRGKLLISTRTNGCPPQVAGCIVWVQGDVVEETKNVLNRFRQLQQETQEKRIAAAQWVQASFGADQVIARILKMI